MSRKQHLKDEQGLFIRPVAEAIGPLTPLKSILNRCDVDALVRAIDTGRLNVFDAGSCLLAHEGVLNIVRDMSRMEAAMLDPKKPRKKKARAPDIRETFDKLADNAMIDDRQLGELTVKGTSTIKRYRRQGKLPPV